MMFAFQRKATRCGIAFTMAASLLISSLPSAFAAPGDINSVNIGKDIPSGTWYNTPDGRTVFKNPGGDLILGAGKTVRGLEVDSTGKLTGNGGNMLFDASGHMMRLDGNIDVRGIVQDGVLGNGGHVQVIADYFYQNGNIFAGGANGGSVQISVGSMLMGPNAQIDASGVSGAGGMVNIKGTRDINIQRGAIIDTSGKVIGNYDTNVIRIEGGLVNVDGILKANGLVAGDQGGAVTLVALSGDVNIGADGKISANGADGFTGWGPTDGGKGGFVYISAKNGRIDNQGEITANGGNGGTNPAVEKGPVIFNPDNGFQQTSLGQNGGRGGDGGEITFVFKKDGMSNNGLVTANGGNGGNGQEAVSDNPKAKHHYAVGGNGGDGGTGGLVTFYGNPSDAVLSHVKVDGGSGGQGGPATPRDCSCGGSAGACGAPGKIAIFPPEDTPPPPPPPPHTPPPVFPPPYPKENPRIGDSLPPGVGSVLSYNRSIFMARAPLPIIQKRKPEVAPPPPPPPPPPPENPKPKQPAPPKRKVTVRGYW